MSETTLLKPNPKNNQVGSTAASPFVTLHGINPLVSAANPLLLLLIKFKNTSEHQDVSGLRRQVINEIAAFEIVAKSLQCSPRLILAARYCLCAALDEVVLLTPWGSNSIWAQQTLLSAIHKETWGGERFFIILEKTAQEPKQNLSLLELIYILLSLGFEGKYYNEEKAVRDEIRHRLFRLIMMHREEPHRKLSPSLKNLQKIDVNDNKRIPKWKIAAVTTGILFLLCLLFNIATYFTARKTLQQLNDISQITGVPVINTITKSETTTTKKHKLHSRRDYDNSEEESI